MTNSKKRFGLSSLTARFKKKSISTQVEEDFLDQSLDANQKAQFQSLPEEDKETLDEAQLAHLKSLPEENEIEKLDATNMAALNALPEDGELEKLESAQMAQFEQLDENKNQQMLSDLNDDNQESIEIKNEVDQLTDISKTEKAIKKTVEVSKKESAPKKYNDSKDKKIENNTGNNTGNKEQTQRNFEHSLQQGLSVQLKNLQFNGKTWSYRKIPVFVFLFENSENTQLKQPVKNVAHITTCADELENLDLWVWVSSNIERCNEHSNQAPIEVCSYCLSSVDFNGFSLLDDARKFELIQNFEFKRFVARFSEFYYAHGLVKKWSENLAIDSVQTETGLETCDNCQWTPKNKDYLFGKTTFDADVTLCVCCITELPKLNVIVPNNISVAAKQARYEQQGGSVQSWDEVRVHLPVKWHQLSFHLQVADMPFPELYQKIKSHSQTEITTVMSWPQANRHVIDDELLNNEFDEELTVWGYQQVLSDVKP
ncbi:hypothetical protein [Marinicellulosiphila megalodicopiae]|uniref:hypothetical protein n=1 Tax=Marinicellulosiphila megalodicopiae TaxID=2724896 RepID=UPI003BB01254